MSGAMDEIHIISLGAGVQSSVMALMASKGLIKPTPVAAIFADTQAEPAHVYKWLDWLETMLSFPVLRVANGSLAKASLDDKIGKRGQGYVQTLVPFFVDTKDGGVLNRSCTRDFKIKPVHRRSRKLQKELGAKKIIKWIGISVDEAHRMKPSRETATTNRWPLIELGMRRSDCLAWMEKNNYPEPPKSSCVFCPFHSDAEWMRIRAADPDGFAAAVKFEADYQAKYEQHRHLAGKPYLHRSFKPLGEVEFLHENQINLWGNECEGMCGV